MASAKNKYYPALSYAVKVSLIIFLTEALIMLLFAVFPIESDIYKVFIDSFFLVILLTPAIYALVYLPLLKEIRLRVDAQSGLEEANRKLNSHARDLERLVDEKVLEKRHTEEQYKALLENSNDIIIIADQDMKTVFWNRLAEESFGYSRQEAVGKALSLIVPEKYREAHEKGFKRFLESGNLKRGKLYDAEGLKRDGTLFPVEISVSSHELGGRRFVTAIIRDTTERRRAEERVKEQVKRLTALQKVDMAISSSLDLRLTLNVLLDQVTETLDVDAADILLFNPSTLCLEYNAGRGFRTDALKYTRLRVGEGYAGKAAYEGRTVCIKDLKAEDGELKRAPLLRQEGFVSYCAVPLFSKGGLKGVLEVYHRSNFEPAPELFDFIDSLALQAAIAVDNAAMFNEAKRSNLELALAYETTLEGWSMALDLRDKETEGHSRRVTEMTVRMAREMGLPEAEFVHIRRGALLHDIGKMGIPDAILLKPGPLTDEEWAIMKKHPVYAYEMLLPIAYLRPALDIPYCHHEKWDGSGYPRGLKGQEIPLSARVFALSDIWDALRSDRPYRPAWSDEKAREHIISISGKELDPEVVKVFLKNECGKNLYSPS